jgi:hypothetical protein
MRCKGQAKVCLGSKRHRPAGQPVKLVRSFRVRFNEEYQTRCRGGINKLHVDLGVAMATGEALVPEDEDQISP